LDESDEQLDGEPRPYGLDGRARPGMVGQLDIHSPPSRSDSPVDVISPDVSRLDAPALAPAHASGLLAYEPLRAQGPLPSLPLRAQGTSPSPPRAS
jgi:hypothetical protein